MKVRLDSITTYFISPCEGKYEQRCNEMRKLADEMKNHFILQRSGNVYPKSLNDAHCSILKQNLNDIPLLLLEDDVKWDGTLELDVPDDADAVYLGNSNAGNGIFHWPSFQKHDATYSRVVTMQSTHAIVYISAQYKEAAAHAIQSSNKVLDVSLSKVQKKFRVYTLNVPMFYQDNDNAKHTNLTVKNIEQMKFRHYSTTVFVFLLVVLLVATMLRS